MSFLIGFALVIALFGVIVFIDKFFSDVFVFFTIMLAFFLGFKLCCLIGSFVMEKYL